MECAAGDSGKPQCDFFRSVRHLTRGFNTSVGRKTLLPRILSPVVANDQSVINGQSVKRLTEPMWIGQAPDTAEHTLLSELARLQGTEGCHYIKT